jgi:Major Facilitator Superfamily.
MSLFERVDFPDEIRKKRAADKRWAVVSIASIPLVMTLGNSMLIPVLPVMQKKLSITPVQSSLILTFYSVFAIIFIPIAGYLSDKWGRKRVIIPSLTVAAVGGTVSAWAAWKLSDPYPFILFGRVLQGIGAAGAFPIVLPLIGDLFRSDKEISSSLGLIETSNTFGKVLSPILGSFFSGFFWFLPFLMIPFFCIASILMMAVFIHSPKKTEAPPFPVFLRGVWQIVRENRRWLLAVFLIGGILMFILFGILFYLSVLLEERFGMGELKKGFLLSVPLGSLCLASFLTGKVIRKNGRALKWAIIVGCGFSVPGIIAFRFFDEMGITLSLFVLISVGIGIGLPCLDTLLTEGVPKDKRGTLSSFYSSMRFIGVAAGPPVIAVLMEKSESFLFLMLAIIMGTGIFLGLLGIRLKDWENSKKRQHPQHSERP